MSWASDAYTPVISTRIVLVEGVEVSLCLYRHARHGIVVAGSMPTPNSGGLVWECQADPSVHGDGAGIRSALSLRSVSGRYKYVACCGHEGNGVVQEEGWDHA